MKNQVPVWCRRCRKMQMISRTAKWFWEDHSDVPYNCPACIAQRIHAAIVDSNAQALDAYTAAYKVARLANASFQLPPLRVL